MRRAKDSPKINAVLGLRAWMNAIIKLSHIHDKLIQRLRVNNSGCRIEFPSRRDAERKKIIKFKKEFVHGSIDNSVPLSSWCD